MGPVIILDKSAIQGLSGDETLFLFKHYYLNITPILLIEILADLKKVVTSPSLSEEQVVRVSRKLLGNDSNINLGYHKLCKGSLLGYDIPMRGELAVGGSRQVRSKAGAPVLILDTATEQMAIFRWKQGQFTEAERILAQIWRLMIQTINLDTYKDRFQRAYLIVPTCNSFAEVRRAVDGILAHASLQLDLLEWLMDDYGIVDNERAHIRERWRSSSSVYLQRFSPYAEYCLRVELSFIVALRDGLIGTKRTNRLDLEYCFYLPFCMVFASRDNLHANLAGMFLRNDQEFVDAGLLKSDLGGLADEWKAMSDSEREDRTYNYGSYPPFRDDSVTSRLWKKYMSPWRPGSGNRAVRMSKEEQKRLLEELRPITETLKEYERGGDQD